MTELESELEVLKEVLRDDDGLTAEDRKDLETEIAVIEQEIAASSKPVANKVATKPNPSKKASKPVASKVATKPKETPKEPQEKTEVKTKAAASTPTKAQTKAQTKVDVKVEPKADSYCLEKAKKVREQKQKAQKEKLFSIASQIPNVNKEELADMSNAAIKKLIQNEASNELKAKAGVKTLKNKVLDTFEREMQYFIQHKIEKVKKKAQLSPEDNKRVGEFREDKVKKAVEELYSAFQAKVFKIDSEVDRLIAKLGKN